MAVGSSLVSPAMEPGVRMGLSLAFLGLHVGFVGEMTPWPLGVNFASVSPLILHSFSTYLYELSGSL